MRFQARRTTVFEYLRRLKTLLISALSVMMAIVLLLSTIELGWVIAKDIITPPYLLLDINELLEIFGLFMLVIIGVELLESIMKTYLSERVDHVQIVMAVAMIAISRKVIILDVKEVSSLTLIGIGVIIAALSTGYFLIRRRRP